MARAPRTTVSATSGQGVSRRAYQTAYALGQKGTGSGFTKPESSGREYGKSKQVDGNHSMNVSFGNTLPISSLDDVKSTPPKRKR